MIQNLHPEEFIRSGSPIIDVRSPVEFLRGHIPGASNLPLFTDEERSEVGTTFKTAGRDRAVLEGLRFVGPKLADFVERARAIARDGSIAVHCWRGGERSGSMAWLLDKAGFKNVLVLKGGYKRFRTMVLDSFAQPYELLVLGGFTGTGKTEVLSLLAQEGEQVIDLEELASHKGSAFGGLGMGPQPRTEQFENLIWSKIAAMDQGRPVWMEDESQMIGQVKIPDTLFHRMRNAELYFAEMPMEDRVERLIKDYGAHHHSELSDAIARITKRLGPQHAKTASDALQAGDLRAVAMITLGYYDKAYLHGLAKRDPQRIMKLHADPDDLRGLVERLKNNVSTSASQG